MECMGIFMLRLSSSSIKTWVGLFALFASLATTAACKPSSVSFSESRTSIPKFEVSWEGQNPKLYLVGRTEKPVFLTNLEVIKAGTPLYHWDDQPFVKHYGKNKKISAENFRRRLER